jgi:hypothetical protein
MEHGLSAVGGLASAIRTVLYETQLMLYSSFLPDLRHSLLYSHFRFYLRETELF